MKKGACVRLISFMSRLLQIGYDFEVGNSFDYRHHVEGAVNFVINLTVDDHSLAVGGDRIYKGSDRGFDDIVVTICTEYVEHSVVVVIAGVVIDSCYDVGVGSRSVVAVYYH